MNCLVSECPGTVEIWQDARSGKHAACARCHCPVSIERLLELLNDALSTRCTCGAKSNTDVHAKDCVLRLALEARTR